MQHLFYFSTSFFSWGLFLIFGQKRKRPGSLCSQTPASIPIQTTPRLKSLSESLPCRHSENYFNSPISRVAAVEIPLNLKWTPLMSVSNSLYSSVKFWTLIVTQLSACCCSAGLSINGMVAMKPRKSIGSEESGVMNCDAVAVMKSTLVIFLP